MGITLNIPPLCNCLELNFIFKPIIQLIKQKLFNNTNSQTTLNNRQISPRIVTPARLFHRCSPYLTNLITIYVFGSLRLSYSLSIEQESHIGGVEVGSLAVRVHQLFECSRLFNFEVDLLSLLNISRITLDLTFRFR